MDIVNVVTLYPNYKDQDQVTVESWLSWFWVEEAPFIIYRHYSFVG